jgi:hypothetical protein
MTSLTRGRVTGLAAFHDKKVSCADVDLGDAGSRAEDDLTNVDPARGNGDPFAGRGSIDCSALG